MANYLPKFTDQTKKRILELHINGKTVREIYKDVNCATPQAIRSFLIRSELTPNPSPSTRKPKIATCKGCGKEFEFKYSGRNSACSPECTSKIIAASKTKYSVDDISSAIDLKKKGIPNRMIEQKTGVNINKIKEIVKENHLYMSSVARQENAYQHKLIKNPNAMSDMRSRLTPEVVRNRTASIVSSYAHNDYDYEAFSRHSREVWAKRRSDPFFYLQMIESGNLNSESKLGFSHEELEKRLLALKSDVEANKGTVSTLADSHGLNFVKACREFNARGWHALLNRMTSQGELDVRFYIQSLIPEEEVIGNTRAIITPLELDVYVPSKKFALEYNGLYWHSSASPAFKRGIHVVKKRAISTMGIKLLAIYEDEWNDLGKRALIKSMIRWRIGAFCGTKIRASDLELVRLDKNRDFEAFFERNHIDGHVRASYAYALAYEGKIISCASVRRNHNSELEIARLATDYDYHVYGGVTKLLSALPKPIVSYSNNRLSDGAVYSSLGFTEITSTTNPSYWYTDLKERIWRFQCRRINEPAVLERFPSEEKQAEGGVFSLRIFGDERPLFRIEDYGHRKWILKPR